MDVQDKTDIEKIIRGRKSAHRVLNKNSDVYRAFLSLEEQAFAPGSLGKMEKELIAIGISIITNCESCMEWHIKEALKIGATETQIFEVIGVGIEMGGGPATVASRFVLKVLDYYRETPVK
jgi:AhpD family alkylhydroperoxidase